MYGSFISLCLYYFIFSKDFEAIGIDKRGFRLRLEKAAKKLPSLLIDIDIPVRHTQVILYKYPIACLRGLYNYNLCV